jgi:macrolide-specific efflux system membrane fusion protein
VGKPLRIVAVLVALALAGAGGYYAWQHFFTTQPPLLLTAKVARGNVEETVLASGMLKPSRLVAVGAQVSGRITSVAVVLGQQVKAGDLIAEIDSVTQENALKIAEAALASTRAQRREREATLSLNEQTLERYRQMLERRAVSQAEYDSAAAAVTVTSAQIEALDAQIAQSEVGIRTAQANLGYTRITAPIDGTVLSVVSQEGQTVNANQAAPTIVILGQLDTMTVQAEISEADIVRVRAGQDLWFTILGEPQRRYEAVLQSIEPAPESIRSDSSIATATATSSSSSTGAIYYNGVFDVPNPDGRLRTYMTAQVNIVLGRATDVLTIPAAALGTSDADGRYAVRVLGADGQIERRKVKIGLNDKVTVEVVEGLSEGDVVVTGQAAAGGASGSGGAGRRFGPPMGL